VAVSVVLGADRVAAGHGQVTQAATHQWGLMDYPRLPPWELKYPDFPLFFAEIH
jgi:hypothetical protein